MAKIIDKQMVTFMSLLSSWVNGNKDLAQDFIDTMGRQLRPIQTITYRVTPNGWPILGQNTTLPVLAAWRQTETYKPRTDESRNCVATVNMKYILPASDDTDTMFAILHRVMETMDIYFDDFVETQYTKTPYAPTPTDILEAVGIIEWANTWDVNYGYEAFDGETLYPTATAKFTLTHEYLFPVDNPPDGIQIWDMLGLFCKYNLKGVYQDGDLPPALNPLIDQQVPEPIPSTPLGPPLQPGTRYSVIR